MIEFKPFTLTRYLPLIMAHYTYIFRYFSKSYQDAETQTEACQEMVKKYILPSIIHSERLSDSYYPGPEEEQFVWSHIKRVPFTKVVQSFLI